MVFFDEFDTALNDRPFAWLRSFLAPMQYGLFLDRGILQCVRRWGRARGRAGIRHCDREAGSNLKHYMN